MTMIETAVGNVHQLDQILPAVCDLGRRHARYGVKAADYDTVAGALLGTLQQALGSEFRNRRVSPIRLGYPRWRTEIRR